MRDFKKKDKCFVCGKETLFRLKGQEPLRLFREAKCDRCGASLRNSAVARTVVETLLDKKGSLKESLDELKSKNSAILEIGSGIIHSFLREVPGYVSAEYFRDVLPGDYKDGTLCENLEKLTFSDGSFDVIITEDVFEHVADYKKAFKEIIRVLKPGGYHIFTVPLHEGQNTKSRNGESAYQALEVFHGDPLNSEGILVQTDFGDDIENILNGIGFATKRIIFDAWYDKNEITKIDSQTEYEEYLRCRENPLSYFKYNNVVFVSEKPKESSEEEHS